MLQQICLKISETILSVLVKQNEITDDGLCDPKNYFKTIYRLQRGVLGVVSGRNLVSDDLFYLNLSAFTSPEKEALDAFEAWYTEQNFGKVNLSDLYELMLLIEFPVRDGSITADSENLNSIGSFYTPSDLANRIVALTLDRYILHNAGIARFSSTPRSTHQIQLVTQLFSQSSFADYSCGTGSFLLAILRYCRLHLHFSAQDLKTIALNFHAIEADALSLEIAKYQVLEAIEDFGLYSELNKKFIHGNPLIAPNEEYPHYDFCHEFYYHNGLTLELDQLPKCDVIIGNPPWGTVGFDLQNYFHLLCPKLNEIADESELEIAIDQLSETHPPLYEWLLRHDEAIDLAYEEVYNDGRFLHSTMGGLHTNVLFTELCDALCSERGTVGLVLKGSTLADPINKRLVDHLQNHRRIAGRYDFLNSESVFNINPNETFSVLILGKNGQQEFTHLIGLTSVHQLP